MGPAAAIAENARESSQAGEKPAAPQTSAAPSPFDRTLFRFTSGLAAGEVARIRDQNDSVLLTYRSFSSAVPVVATVVAAIVIVAGLSASLFLAAEGQAIPAIISLVLSAFFALVIVMLVPASTVTMYAGSSPALTISQRSRSTFPAVVYAVLPPEGAPLALFRKSIFSRLGRNRWHVSDPRGAPLATAVEESLTRALMRKAAGKFNRAFEADVVISRNGRPVARVVRRAADPQRSPHDVDVLRIESTALDPRVTVALATLILGSEP